MSEELHAKGISCRYEKKPTQSKHKNKSHHRNEDPMHSLTRGNIKKEQPAAMYR